MMPCMSCGGMRNEPPREGCLDVPNHVAKQGWYRFEDRERWWMGKQWGETYRSLDPGPTVIAPSTWLGEFEKELEVALGAREGDSNDQEIEALWNVVEMIVPDDVMTRVQARVDKGREEAGDD